jgi:hypothetical protein
MDEYGQVQRFVEKPKVREGRGDRAVKGCGGRGRREMAGAGAGGWAGRAGGEERLFVCGLPHSAQAQRMHTDGRKTGGRIAGAGHRTSAPARTAACTCAGLDTRPARLTRPATPSLLPRAARGMSAAYPSQHLSISPLTVSLSLGLPLGPGCASPRLSTWVGPRPARRTPARRRAPPPVGLRRRAQCRAVTGQHAHAPATTLTPGPSTPPGPRHTAQRHAHPSPHLLRPRTSNPLPPSRRQLPRALDPPSPPPPHQAPRLPHPAPHLDPPQPDRSPSSLARFSPLVVPALQARHPPASFPFN